MSKWAFSRVVKACSIFKNQLIYDINRLQKKSHTNISIDVEQAFHKIQHHTNAQKNRNRNFPHLVKSTYKNPTINITSSERLDVFHTYSVILLI